MKNLEEFNNSSMLDISIKQSSSFIENIFRNTMKDISNNTGARKKNRSNSNVGSSKRSSPRKISDIYPNLSKISPIENENSCNNKKLQTPINKDKIKKEPSDRIKILCNMCNTLVKKTKLNEHLFFGSIKCLDCGWTENDCSNFFKKNSIMSPEDGFCCHVNLQWENEILNNLKRWLGYSSSGKREFKSTLQNYLNCLGQLSISEPWVRAFTTCNNLIKEKKKRQDVDHFVNLPEDERYFVCKEPIQECPECYTSISLEHLVFHLDSTLIKINCTKCSLLVMFVLDPPDGSEPPIRIF